MLYSEFSSQTCSGSYEPFTGFVQKKEFIFSFFEVIFKKPYKLRLNDLSKCSYIVIIYYTVGANRQVKSPVKIGVLRHGTKCKLSNIKLNIKKRKEALDGSRHNKNSRRTNI